MANNPTCKSYVHYDKTTGEILAISNCVVSTYEVWLEVESSTVIDLISGVRQFNEYFVNYKKLLDGSIISEVVFKEQLEFLYQFKEFELISENTNDDAVLVVEWDYPNKEWHFILNNASLKTRISVSPLLFFVTLDADFDFLIQCRTIEPTNLQAGRVTVPFASNIEHNIKNIAISSKLVFKSYRLKIINE